VLPDPTESPNDQCMSDPPSSSDDGEYFDMKTAPVGEDDHHLLPRAFVGRPLDRRQHSHKRSGGILDNDRPDAPAPAFPGRGQPLCNSFSIPRVFPAGRPRFMVGDEGRGGGASSVTAQRCALRVSPIDRFRRSRWMHP